MKPEKNYNVFEVDGIIFLENHKEGSYHIGEFDVIDVNCLNDIADELNNLYEENEQLKQQIDEMITVFENSGLDYHISDELNEILNR